MIEKENKTRLDTFFPQGKLFVHDLTYFLLNWLDRNDDRCEFFVVPFDPIRLHVPLSTDDDLFGWARRIVISGDFLIEYGACNKIQCLRPPEKW